MPELTQEQFIAKYEPIRGADGEFARFSMFTRSEEKREMYSNAEREGRIWTLRDKDGELLIMPGSDAYPVETYITGVACTDRTDFVFIRGCEDEDETDDVSDLTEEKHFSFRADCKADVDEFQRQCSGSDLTFSLLEIVPDVVFPDVDVEITSGGTLEDLRNAARRVVDGHVILQTLRESRLADNSLERDMDLK